MAMIGFTGTTTIEVNWNEGGVLKAEISRKERFV